MYRKVHKMCALYHFSLSKNVSVWTLNQKNSNNFIIWFFLLCLLWLWGRQAWKIWYATHGSLTEKPTAALDSGLHSRFLLINKRFLILIICYFKSSIFTCLMRLVKTTLISCVCMKWSIQLQSYDGNILLCFKKLKVLESSS